MDRVGKSPPGPCLSWSASGVEVYDAVVHIMVARTATPALPRQEQRPTVSGIRAGGKEGSG